ncbi:hypothetical protein ACFSL4_12630 [Streptomyces caeni]|uniref:Uncharacterized protein n=1 Tax=Streptomyces caeni TaxID=2307231 RepID=A0ABW4IP26_9ACTN
MSVWFTTGTRRGPGTGTAGRALAAGHRAVAAARGPRPVPKRFSLAGHRLPATATSPRRGTMMPPLSSEETSGPGTGVGGILPRPTGPRSDRVHATVTRGEADPSVAVEDVIDLLFGPLVFRRLTVHYALTDKAAVSLARTALRGLLRRRSGAASQDR